MLALVVVLVEFRLKFGVATTTQMFVTKSLQRYIHAYIHTYILGTCESEISIQIEYQISGYDSNSNRISNRIGVIVYMFNADCRRSFSVSGPDAWNSLPCQLRGIVVASTFKRRLKSELFFQAYGVSTTASTVAEP